MQVRVEERRAVELDLEVGNAVAVHVAGEHPPGVAQLSRDAGEGRVAESDEGLVFSRRGDRIHCDEVDHVSAGTTAHHVTSQATD